MTKKISYANAHIPEGKDPKTYSHVHRRAEILRFIMEAGHPGLIHQSRLAQRYGVTPGQITQDMKAVKQEIVDTLGDDFEVVLKAAFMKAIKLGMKSDKLYDNIAAARLAKDWADFGFDIGVRQKNAQRIEVEGSVNHMSLADAYKWAKERHDKEEKEGAEQK